MIPQHQSPSLHPSSYLNGHVAPKLYLMFTSSRSVTMDTAHQISVSHLVNTVSGGMEQVKFCKLDPSAKLQLCNVHSNKFLVRKTCKIKIFTKVDQIIDKTWLNQNTLCYIVFGLWYNTLCCQSHCFLLTNSIKSLNLVEILRDLKNLWCVCNSLC